MGLVVARADDVEPYSLIANRGSKPGPSYSGRNLAKVAELGTSGRAMRPRRFRCSAMLRVRGGEVLHCRPIRIDRGLGA
jgi:hypothetical protein